MPSPMSPQVSIGLAEISAYTVTSLLEISVNVKGDVKFLRNKLVSNGPPMYGIDSVSRKPNIDHDPLLIVERDLMPPTPSDKKRSEFTKDIRNHYQQLNQRSNASVSFDVSKYKRCKKCLRFENSDALRKWAKGEEATATEKFRHCGRCRAVAYCSKECKVAHWPDHRLLCKSQKTK